MNRQPGEGGDKTLEALRDQAQSALSEQSILLSERVRQYVHGCLHEALKRDRTLDDLLIESPLEPGQSADFYVLEDLLAAPKNEGKFLRCLSLKLENSYEDGSVSRGDDKLFVYVPVPEGVTHSVGEIEPPSVIYLEHKSTLGEPTRYEVGTQGVMPYSAARDGGEVTELDLLFEEPVDNPDHSLRTGLPALAAIYENMTNMQIVHQRRITQGESGLHIA